MGNKHFSWRWTRKNLNLKVYYQNELVYQQNSDDIQELRDFLLNTLIDISEETIVNSKKNLKNKDKNNQISTEVSTKLAGTFKKLSSKIIGIKTKNSLYGVDYLLMNIGKNLDCLEINDELELLTFLPYQNK